MNNNNTTTAHYQTTYNANEVEISISDLKRHIKITTNQRLTYGLTMELMKNLCEKLGKAGLDIAEYDFSFEKLYQKN